MSESYQFTEDWFSKFAPTWRQLISRIQPRRILEIGSYEGRSACFLIEECASVSKIELHCVDTWKGGVEHDPNVMDDVEKRFDRNIEIARSSASYPVDLYKHVSTSIDLLARLIAEGRKDYFDLIYIDGSHLACDVLTDAVMSFQLLRVGGIMIFDDYLWSMDPAGQQDHYNLPKPAIDAFVNIFRRKVNVFDVPLYQLYLEKGAG